MAWAHAGAHCAKRAGGMRGRGQNDWDSRYDRGVTGGLLRRPVGHLDLAFAPVNIAEMREFAAEPAVFQVTP